MNIFEPASNDQSIYYLGQIFGGVGTTLKGQDPSAITLLGNMFQLFNTVILSVAVLIVIYVTVMGVMATAHEGEFLGKQWHKLWTPIRMVLGVAALVPTASGYSAIQIVLMWIIVQGVGAADQLWTRVLNFQAIMHSPTARFSPSSTAALDKFQKLFKGLTCAASVQTDYAQGVMSNNQLCQSGSCLNTDPTSFSTMINQQLQSAYADPRASNFQLFPGSNGAACGKVEVCNPAQCAAIPGDPSKSDYQIKKGLCEAACNAQKDILAKNIDTLAQLASKVALADRDYAVFYSTSKDLRVFQSDWIKKYCVANNIPSNLCCIPASNPVVKSMLDPKDACQGTVDNMPAIKSSGAYADASVNSDTLKNLYWNYALDPSPSADFLNVVTNNYTAAIGKAVNDYINSRMNSSDSKTKFSDDPDYQKANSVGWILAGSYYYKLARSSDANTALGEPTFNVVISPEPTVPNNSVYKNRNNYQAVNDLLTQIQNDSQNNKSNNGGGQISSPPSQLSGTTSLVNQAGRDILNSFQQTVSGTDGTDPVIQMQSLGRGILITIEVLFWALLALTLGLGIAGSISVFVAGFGVTNPLQPALAGVYYFLVPLLLAFMGTFLALGGMLAVYVPLIPYVIFTMGGLGWMMAAIEAMVAAPLVALGILSPSHHGHEILGKAEPALLLIFGTFLRPTLMIFGMMASMFLAIQGARLINAGFQYVMYSLTAPSPSLLELIFFMASYVMLMIAMLNKCFSLIYLIPERVMRWIGGHADQYGEAEGLSSVKEGVTTATGIAGGAAAAAQPKMAEAIGQVDTAGRAKEAKDKGDTGIITGMSGGKKEGE